MCRVGRIQFLHANLNNFFTSLLKCTSDNVRSIIDFKVVTCMYCVLQKEHTGQVEGEREKKAPFHQLRARRILTHSEWRPQNIYSQEEMNLYGIIKLATEISLFSFQISKLDVFCRQNKTWTFGNPFQSKKLPSWGFADYFT